MNIDFDIPSSIKKMSEKDSKVNPQYLARGPFVAEVNGVPTVGMNLERNKPLDSSMTSGIFTTGAKTYEFDERFTAELVRDRILISTVENPEEGMKVLIRPVSLQDADWFYSEKKEINSLDEFIDDILDYMNSY